MHSVAKNIVNYILSISCFVCIYWFHQFLFEGMDGTYMIAAFGASAVLIFSNNPLKHSFFIIALSSVFSAIIGVFMHQLDLDLVIKISLTISTCILLMNLFNISYPPAGAIAIIPLISNSEVQNLGYLYALYPTLSGLLIIYSFSKIQLKINTTYYGYKKNH